MLQAPPINFHFTRESVEVISLRDTLAGPPPFDIPGPIAIVGNPPYRADSQNNNPWIMKLLESYKAGLAEKNLKPLNDDYVKFLRYAQWVVEMAGQGIVGMITNNSFLDGLIHRVMRASLLELFDRVYILNLHGHRRQDGDESIFDIDRVGVCILFLCKFPRPFDTKEVYYFSTRDNGKMTREVKLSFLQSVPCNQIPWTTLAPRAPHYWFVPQGNRNWDWYLAAWPWMKYSASTRVAWKRGMIPFSLHLKAKKKFWNTACARLWNLQITWLPRIYITGAIQLEKHCRNSGSTGRKKQFQMQLSHSITALSMYAGATTRGDISTRPAPSCVTFCKDNNPILRL